MWLLTVTNSQPIAPSRAVNFGVIYVIVTVAFLIWHIYYYSWCRLLLINGTYFLDSTEKLRSLYWIVVGRPIGKYGKQLLNKFLTRVTDAYNEACLSFQAETKTSFILFIVLEALSKKSELKEACSKPYSRIL